MYHLIGIFVLTPQQRLKEIGNHRYCGGKQAHRIECQVYRLTTVYQFKTREDQYDPDRLQPILPSHLSHMIIYVPGRSCTCHHGIIPLLFAYDNSGYGDATSPSTHMSGVNIPSPPLPIFPVTKPI